MEAIVAIALIFGGIWAVGALFRTLGAAFHTATGRGSMADNMNVAFKGMPPLEIRFKDTRLGEPGSGPLAKEVEGRGLFPVDRRARIGFVTSVFDATSSNEYSPVLSALEAFQEPVSSVYQHLVEVGPVSPNQGLVSWVRLGVVIPDIIQPPYSGNRQLVAVVRMVDLDDPPSIVHGFHDEGDRGLLWAETIQFDYQYPDKGYLEAAKDRDEARSLSLKIGIAVAMADGTLDQSEGELLRVWVKRKIEIFTEEKQAELKKLYNQAMRDAYAEARQGELSLSALTGRLNDIGEKKLKYDAIELCFDVMSADGVADPAELRTIRQVAEALNLDLDEIENLRDQKIVGLKSSVSEQTSIEELLGIESSWTNEQIKRHLRTEFQKWNNRLNALPEGEERENAQRMLDAISEARTKYG